MNSSELEKVVAPELEGLGFECVKLEIVGSPRSPIIRLYIDREEGVSIKHFKLKPMEFEGANAAVER